MRPCSKAFKTAALAGFFGLGLVVLTTGPAQAERDFARCGYEGCLRAPCDGYRDGCRRYETPAGWYGPRNDYDPYRHDRRRDWYRHHYYDHRDGRWVCTGNSEYCRWTERRW